MFETPNFASNPSSVLVVIISTYPTSQPHVQLKPMLIEISHPNKKYSDPALHRSLAMQTCVFHPSLYLARVVKYRPVSHLLTPQVTVLGPRSSFPKDEPPGANMQRGRPLYQICRLHLADAVSHPIQREQPEDDSICSHPSHRVRISDPAPHHPDKQTNEKPPSTQLPPTCLPQAPHLLHARHSPPLSLSLCPRYRVRIATKKRPVTPTTSSHGATGSVSVTRKSLGFPVSWPRSNSQGYKKTKSGHGVVVNSLPSQGRYAGANPAGRRYI